MLAYSGSCYSIGCIAKICDELVKDGIADKVKDTRNHDQNGVYTLVYNIRLNKKWGDRKVEEIIGFPSFDVVEIRLFFDNRKSEDGIQTDHATWKMSWKDMDSAVHSEQVMNLLVSYATKAFPKITMDEETIKEALRIVEKNKLQKVESK